MLFNPGIWIVFDTRPSDGLITLRLTGRDLSSLDNEIGIHRIQRVPPTEKKGRVHTSSVTVAVTNPNINSDVRYESIDDSDFRIEWFSGTGKGGQRRNKVKSSCRLIHIPTGLTQTAQTRSRESSLAAAKSKLLDALTELKASNHSGTINAIRVDQIQSGITRTYNFKRNTVTDVNGTAASMKDVLRGKFDLLWI